MRLLILGTIMNRTQGGANQALLLLANRLAQHPRLKPIVYLYSVDRELLDPSIPIILGNEPRSPRFLWRFPSTHYVSWYRDELGRAHLPEADAALCVNLHLAAAYKEFRPDAALITYQGAVLASAEVMEEFPSGYFARRIEAALTDRIERWLYRQPRSTHLAQTALVAKTRETHFGLPRGLFKICPGGVDDSVFTRKNVQTDLRASLHIPNDAFVVVTTARLVPWKRIEMIIDAVGKMDNKTYLLVVGDGPQRAPLEARAAGSQAGGRIIFAGWISFPADWLAAADVFVLTSRIESFGLVYAEAMMVGLPCIGSMHEPPEVISSAADVIPEGKAGYCVNSIEMLVDRLELLRSDAALRARMAASAEALAKSEYTIGRFIENIEREVIALAA